ncbi:protein adenylyltransferase SelO [Szabonella alba]|uniref:Protein nucleotidyltransferase YdiU n=1 Tax=Szabonella alba TaxID=2804194 RepID=A0A8K0VDQ1_9RHOB|nr:YdiU family protein [Szabonella alba]MBL4918313.1 YdiU family protein [Szabonella alba]
MSAPFVFDNSYARDLEGFYTLWPGAVAPAPRILRLNTELAQELGLDPAALDAEVLTGSRAPEGAQPLAMAYAGHQFGGFSPQLGDGRAILLGEVIDSKGARRDIHLKGSGRTPFSRGGDGKAVLGPVLREYLIGEAMQGLGIPTTRALAACTTGEQVLRQNGPEPGAVLARVAASHLRVGTFQFFAARREVDRVAQLLDYAIARHDPDLAGKTASISDRALAFLGRVTARQADLIAAWMSVGFVHGVMNTDNMTISGETIDYGPCAFLDAHHPEAVFSSIDTQGRYAFGNQPGIAQWNLARLAETLLSVIAPGDAEQAIAPVTAVLEGFPDLYRDAWLRRMRAKLGLERAMAGDEALITGLLDLLTAHGADFTRSFRALSGDRAVLTAMISDRPALEDWLGRWQQRAAQEEAPPEAQAARMRAANPVYIPRNHKVEEALTAAGQGDMAPFERLLSLVSAPFDAVPGAEGHALPAPAGFGPYRTFCGT